MESARYGEDKLRAPTRVLGDEKSVICYLLLREVVRGEKGHGVCLRVGDANIFGHDSEPGVFEQGYVTPNLQLRVH